ncbi:MAG: hypothetical protein ACKVOQ_18190 [Cyclobacteriaceae bacterium]
MRAPKTSLLTTLPPLYKVERGWTREARTGVSLRRSITSSVTSQLMVREDTNHGRGLNFDDTQKVMCGHRPGIEVERLPRTIVQPKLESSISWPDHSKRVAGLERIARWPLRLAGPGRQLFSTQNYFTHSLIVCVILLASSCDLIRMKKGDGGGDNSRRAVARVEQSFLYLDELKGIVPSDASKEDSATRISSYVNSWIRKQLLLNEAAKNIDINEAEVERKVLDYRYSLIGYEFQNFYIQKNLNDSVSWDEIETYYKSHQDNFILKQNIVQGTYIKVPKTAPRINRVKELMFSKKPKDMEELKSYCLRFSAAYQLPDSTWIEFDKLAANSPLAEIPNKIQFLRSYSYYETNDVNFLYFLKLDAYKISDNVSPLEFVQEDIKNIILNKRKVELAKKLEDEVYENAAKRKDFEVFNP